MSTRQSWKSFFSTQRHVNLIYFVDAAKTKTIRVNLRTASICMIFAGLLVAWALSSGFLLLRLQAKQGDLRNELASARSVIFEYQTLHDGVFEQAYPELKDRRPVASQATSRPTSVAQVDKAAERKSGEAQATPADKGAVAAREPSKSPVSLSNPSVVRRDGAFEVFFDLKNSDSEKKAEGFIWGVAAMENQSGDRINVTVPDSLPLSPAGEPVDVESGERFGIRRFARRSFVFPVPPKFEGRVLKVDIAVAGQDGKYRSSYTIPVNMRFSRLASNTTGAEAKPVKESAAGGADLEDASLDSRPE